MSTLVIEPRRSSLETEVQITAKLRGLTPILMHSPAGMQAVSGEVQRTSAKRIPVPEEEARLAEYRGEDGILYAPSRWITRAMIEAGKQFKNPQNARSSMMKTLAAAIVPPPILGFPFFDSDGEAMKDYPIDIQRVVIQRAAVMRARPLIDNWTLYINLGIDTSVLSGSLEDTGRFLCDVLETAGSKQGLGDFRPERGGSYGRFEVESFEISDNS